METTKMANLTILGDLAFIAGGFALGYFWKAVLFPQITTAEAKILADAKAQIANAAATVAKKV